MESRKFLSVMEVAGLITSEAQRLNGETDLSNEIEGEVDGFINCSTLAIRRFIAGHLDDAIIQRGQEYIRVGDLIKPKICLKQLVDYYERMGYPMSVL